MTTIPTDTQLTETEKLVAKTLAAKPFYRPEMGPVLAGILDCHCRTHSHRVRVCRKAIGMYFGPEGRLEDRCPGPAELAELCRETSAEKPRGEASSACEYCHGDGFEPHGSGVKRCRCGGSPMSHEARLRYYRQELARQTPEAQREYAEWKASFGKR